MLERGHSGKRLLLKDKTCPALCSSSQAERVTTKNMYAVLTLRFQLSQHDQQSHVASINTCDPVFVP